MDAPHSRRGCQDNQVTTELSQYFAKGNAGIDHRVLSALGLTCKTLISKKCLTLRHLSHKSPPQETTPKSCLLLLCPGTHEQPAFLACLPLSAQLQAERDSNPSLPTVGPQYAAPGFFVCLF